MLSFAGRVGSQTLTPHKSALIAHKRLELATVARVQSASAAFITEFKLTLAFAVVFELRGCRGSQCWDGDGGCRFNQCDGQ